MAHVIKYGTKFFLSFVGGAAFAWGAIVVDRVNERIEERKKRNSNIVEKIRRWFRRK